MATSYIAKLFSNGTFQVPDEAITDLDLNGVKEVAIIRDQNGIHLVPLRMTIDEVRGSVPGIAGLSDDLDDEIEEAIELALQEKYG